MIMKKYPFTLVLFAAVVCILFSSSCNEPNNGIELKVSCDAEELSENEEYFMGGKSMFGNADTRSDEKAHSGKYAVKLTKENPYGMTYTDKYSHADAYYDISVWRYGKQGALVLSDEEGKIYVLSDVADSVSKDGWERIRLKTFIPPTFEKGKIKIYVWTAEEDHAFFDDLRIERLKEKIYPEYKGDVLELKIDSLGMDKLRSVRYTAFIRGTLQSDEWIIATIKYRGVEMPVKLRLKGDWLDHLQGEKWSFRIKLKKGYAWNRLREFSIQNPDTRNFISEWTLHQLLKKEDVLTTRYGFIPVKLNGKSLGVYAWEEHFTKQLLESKQRKEAPILKYNEDAFWEFISFSDAKDPIIHYLPKFDAAEILPFKQKSTLSSPRMKKLLITGQNLLLQLSKGSSPISEIIDLDAMAKYYAITSLTSAYHGYSWHNLRFYVNPVTQKLEPIAFDGYPGIALKDDELQQILGFSAAGDCSSTIKDKEDFMLKGLLNDSIFRRKYEAMLAVYSDQAFIDSFITQIRPKEVEFEKMLQKEFPAYHYNDQQLRQKGKLIRTVMKDKSNYCRSHYVYASDTLATDTDYCTLERPTNSMSVKAYLENEKNGIYELALLNYHCRPLRINGTGSSGLINSRILKSLILPAKDPNSLPAPVSLKVKAGATQVFYSEIKGGPVYHVNIILWPRPVEYSTQQKLNSSPLADGPYSVHDSIIQFKTGLSNIKDNIVIPTGYRVIIPAGATLNITDSARIICYSPVDIQGTRNKTVLITSKDESAGGFSVINAGKRSNFNYVTFEHLATLDYCGWTLTGAVTMYESPVSIDHCVFSDNLCEDALNLVRSNFQIRQAIFKNTRSDGLDCDFSNGTIDSIVFRQIGNDGLDVSGSKLKIKYCKVINAMDKGISVGEESEVSISKADVGGCNIAVCSKDLSEMNISKLSMKNCNYGYALFMKKAEYGPSNLKINRMHATKVTEMYVVDKGCVLQIGDKKINGGQKVDVTAFYDY